MNYNSDELEWYSKQLFPNFKDYINKNIVLFRTYKNIKYLDISNI